MKSILVALLLVASLIVQGQQSKDETVIRQLLKDQTIAWNKGDLGSFMKGYWKNDSLMFIGKSGITYGWANTLSNYKKGFPDRQAMGKLDFTIIVVKRLSPDYFQAVGKWHLVRIAGDLSGHFTLLFRKIGSEWVIVSDHSS